MPPARTFPSSPADYSRPSWSPVPSSDGGGDEFGLLLPETGYDAAGVVVQKEHRSLRSAVAGSGWPVMFSAGVANILSPPDSVDGMLKIADAFLHSLRLSGKNRIKHEEIEYRTA